MTGAPAEIWPWLALAGLGAFHGLNPAMGWLFAVALGIHRRDRRVVWVSPLAIAAGHVLAVTLTAGFLLWAGLAMDFIPARIVAGTMLAGWAVYHCRYGHRHRVRFGMRIGIAGLVAWSFLMATAHGAGLMLWPVLTPLCRSGADTTFLDGLFWPAAAGIALHTAALLSVSTSMAVVVYEWAGVAVLRRGWINFDLLWTLALAGASAFVFLS